MRYTINDILNVLSESTQDSIEDDNPELFIEAVSPLIIPIFVIGGLITKTITDIKQSIKEDELKEIERQKKDKEEIDNMVSHFNSKKPIFTLDDKDLKIDTVDDVFKHVESDVKKIVNFIKKDSKYKQRIKTKIEESISRYKKDIENKKSYDGNIDEKVAEYKRELETFEFVFVLEKLTNSLMITLLEGEQEARITMGFILDDIERVIKAKYTKVFSHFNIKMDSGDGDEGSLYLEVKKNK